MSRLVALFRGVNVGGHRRLPMADLRELLVDLGHSDVETYLQSGNAVFKPGGRAAPAAVATRIERAVLDRFGFDVIVVPRTADQLRDVVDTCPMPEAMAEPKKLHVAFLAGPTTPAEAGALDDPRFAPDEVALASNAHELYVWFREGAGRSKLTPAVLARTLGVESTARNWTTVLALAEMSA